MWNMLHSALKPRSNHMKSPKSPAIDGQGDTDHEIREDADPGPGREIEIIFIQNPQQPNQADHRQQPPSPQRPRFLPQKRREKGIQNRANLTATVGDRGPSGHGHARHQREGHDPSPLTQTQFENKWLSLLHHRVLRTEPINPVLGHPIAGPQPTHGKLAANQRLTQKTYTFTHMRHPCLARMQCEPEPRQMHAGKL